MKRSSVSRDDFVSIVKSRVAQCVRSMFGPTVSEPALAYHERGGKALRTGLVYDFALGYGCDIGQATQVAAVTELFHNFALVHDDIEDSALMRRGGPSLHTKYGIPIAVNAGDALFAASWLCLSELTTQPSCGARELLKLYSRTLSKTIGGQGKELFWVAKHRWDVCWTDLRDMIVGKTSWYSAVFPTLAVAELTKLPESERTLITRFGELLGLIYQLVDDLRPYTGATDGKDIMSDLIEGKRTLVILLTLALLPPTARRRLREKLDEGPSSEDPTYLDSILEIVQSVNAVDLASDIVRSEGESCLSTLRSLSMQADSVRSVEDRVEGLLAQLPPHSDIVATRVTREAKESFLDQVQAVPVGG